MYLKPLVSLLVCEYEKLSTRIENMNEWWVELNVNMCASIYDEI